MIAELTNIATAVAWIMWLWAMLVYAASVVVFKTV